jgi:hypothetical protein
MKMEAARVSKLQVPNDTYLKRKATKKKFGHLEYA